MKTDETKYTKIHSETSNFIIGGQRRIMLANDHLLIANRLVINEEYRRFYLNEIRQITVYRTSWALIISLFYAAVLALFVILTLLAAASKEQWMAYFLGVVSIIILSMLIFQLFGGPSCKVLITTLNSKDSILFAYRFHKTLQILKRIRPMIEAGQGGVSRNETIDKLIGTSATPTQNEGAEPETE